MKQNSGKLFLVVGPSGVGKDSLLEFARIRLAHVENIRFVRRTITRPADSGGEVHDAISEESFLAEKERGGFAVSWCAHGLHYGIPANVRAFVEAGGTAIANGSRHALPHFYQAFASLAIVSIVAKPEILAARLRLRGRESEADIQARLERPHADYSGFGDVFEIDNSGALEVAGERLVAIIEAASPHPGQNERRQAESALDRFMNNSWPFL